MERRYADLGLTTAIARQGYERAASADGEYLRRHLNQIEAALPGFNLEPAMAHLAAEIAAFDETLTVAQRVALVMLIVASLVAQSEGSTRLPVTGPQARAPLARILGPLCSATADGIDPAQAAAMAGAIAELLEGGAAAAVIGRSPDDYRPLIYLPPYIYHQRIRVAEAGLAERLRELLGARGAVASTTAIAAALADVYDRPQVIDGREITLSDEQRTAVRNSATQRLAIVSGGPGTGKTSLVLAMVRMLVRLGIEPSEIALAAPTGKAAHRMGASIREGLAQVRDPGAADGELGAQPLEALTIHRLLGYAPGRGIFTHHRNNPLPAAVTIVDECSMLDLELMQRLTAALRPEGRLVLMGDVDQLPSVTAGAVLRDLVAALTDSVRGAERRNCTRLTQNYRMNRAAGGGRAIFMLAQRINQGTLGEAAEAPLIQARATPAELRFEGVEAIEAGSASIDEFLERWYDEKIRGAEIEALASTVYEYGESGFDLRANAELKRACDRQAAGRILCATRVAADGAERINAALHRRAVAAAGIRTAPRLLAGEPVMMLRNDYDLNLFNGDQGVIARVRRPDDSEAPMAVFMRGERGAAYSLAAIGHALELCYATTIHKAQGSEFDCVAVVLGERSAAPLTRELLYTAVSRARESVILAGSIERVRAAAARPGARYSGLAELLGAVGA
jgi:exodeoxyribonuclease V alpha subunit